MVRDDAVVKRNYLAYGFGISIALHLIVLPFVHPQPTVAEEERAPDFRVDHIPTPPPTPPSTPTPKPTAPPTPPPREHPPTPAPHAEARIRPPHTDAHGGGPAEHGNRHDTGDVNGTVTQPGPPAPGTDDVSAPPAPPAATAAPTPKPTPTPLSCARPNVAATTLRPLEPDTPALAQQQGIAGVVQVVVSLDAQSRVVGTRILSSPSALLNQAALGAARGSQFRTEVKNCEPIAADYVFSVDFTSQ
jgi:outer membrane biosynthesis protein TonB